MSVYPGKLLELLAVIIENNQSFLKVKLFSEQEVELLWCMDEETAKSLQAIIEPEGHMKYRLSFHGSWDSTRNQYVSYLTKTFRDQSQKVYFVCSKDYVNGLYSIKNEEDIHQLHFLTPSIDTNPPVPAVSIQAGKPRPAGTRIHRKSKYAGIAIAIILTLLVCLLGSFKPPFIYMTASGEDTKLAANTSYTPMNTSLEGTKEMKALTSLKSPSSTDEPMDLSEPQFHESAIPAAPLELDTKPVSEDKQVIPSIILNEAVSYSVPKGNVAITFDDGPSRFTNQIVEVLQEYEVGATFFFIGKNVVHYPDAVQYVHVNGYSIGSHSMNHHNLADLPQEKQEYEMLHTNELIEGLVSDKILLFRPPYGSKNQSTLELIENNHNKMVLWNIDPEDWKSRDADDIYHAIVNSKVDGSIILLHETQATIDALPRIIKYLQENHLEIVNLQ